jgi:hypothetical protein
MQEKAQNTSVLLILHRGTIGMIENEKTEHSKISTSSSSDIIFLS